MGTPPVTFFIASSDNLGRSLTVVRLAFVLLRFVFLGLVGFGITLPPRVQRFFRGYGSRTILTTHILARRPRKIAIMI